MKTFIVLTLFISSLAQAVVPETARNLTGSYTAFGSCAFEAATVKVERENDMDYLVVRLSNKSTETYRSRSINLDNLWTKVRTTRGMQRIVTMDRIREGKMIAEEKTCLPGWVNCSDWKTALEASLSDDNTMEVTLGEETCTMVRVQNG